MPNGIAIVGVSMIMAEPIMRKSLLLLTRMSTLLLAVVACSASGQAQPACKGRDMLAELRLSDPQAHARITSQSARITNTEALLWRIDRQGLPPSYLFGTAHLSDERITTLSPAIRQAMADTHIMAFEVADLSPESMAAAISKNVHLFVYTDGRQLEHTLAPDQFAKATGVLAAAGMPAAVASRIKPWLVFMMLAVPACERHRQSSGKPALDMQLAADARRRGIPVVGLETLEGQLSMLAEIPEDQQIAMLRAVLHHADRTEDQMETIVQLYLNRQMGLALPFQHELARTAGVAADAFDAFEKDIVIKRNVAMAESAKPLLAKGEAFVGVGALHLIGPNGLVALFRQAGYTVTAVE